MSRPQFRLPQSFLILALMLAFGTAVISGGVGVSQYLGGAGLTGVDWSVFAGSAAAAALIVLVWRFAPVAWVGDEEIQRLKDDELEVEAGSAAGRRNIFLRGRFWMAAAAFAVGCRMAGFLGARRLLPRNTLDMNTPIPNGGSGTTILGATLGTVRLFGHDWTGVELAMIIPLLAFLTWALWSGFARIARINRDT